jgi:hypothetical protein
LGHKIQPIMTCQSKINPAVGNNCFSEKFSNLVKNLKIIKIIQSTEIILIPCSLLLHEIKVQNHSFMLQISWLSSVVNSSPSAQILANTGLLYEPIVLILPEYHIKEIVNPQDLESDFFHLTQCIWNSTMLLHISAIHSFFFPDRDVQ